MRPRLWRSTLVGLLLLGAATGARAQERGQRRDGRSNPPRAGCDYTVARVSIGGEHRVDAWIANQGTLACGVFIVTLEITDAKGENGRDPEINVPVKGGLDVGASTKVSFEVPRGVSLKARGLRVTVDKANFKQETSDRNNVKFLAPAAAAPGATATPHPTKPAKHTEAGSSTADLSAVGIELYTDAGDDLARGTVRNLETVKYVGKRTARLSRRVIFEDGEGEDVVLETQDLHGMPGGAEWAVIAKVPPGVRKATGYVWTLAIDPGDSDPDNDSIQKQIKLVRLD